MLQMPEEDSFAVLVKIMQDYRMREMFKPSMAELGLCMYQLDTLVQEHIPDLYVHFQSQVMLELNTVMILLLTWDYYCRPFIPTYTPVPGSSPFLPQVSPWCSPAGRYFLEDSRLILL